MTKMIPALVLLCASLLGGCGSSGESKEACLRYLMAVDGCYARAGSTTQRPTSECDDPTWDNPAVYECMIPLWEQGNCNSDITMISITDGLPDCYNKN